MSQQVRITYPRSGRAYCYRGSSTIYQWDQPVCPFNGTFPYGDCTILLSLLSNYSDRIQGKTGIVVGSLAPWIECHLVALGASKVITLEYNKINVSHPQIIPMQPQELAETLLNGTFPHTLDFAVSFSSVEHSGLTRYGDLINPFGDLEAVAQIYCITSAKATLFLGVPTDLPKDQIIWPLHRIYGQHRWPHLVSNWKCFDSAPKIDTVHGWNRHGTVVCTKA